VVQAHWVVRVPRIAGDPPGAPTQASMLQMTLEDAEAVLAHLKSLRQ